MSRNFLNRVLSDGRVETNKYIYKKFVRRGLIKIVRMNKETREQYICAVYAA